MSWWRVRTYLRNQEGAKALLLIISWKIATFAIIYLAFSLLPFNQALRKAQVLAYPPNNTPTFATTFTTWDSSHYLYLAEQGYKPKQISNAFSPLYPLSIRALNLVTRNSIASGLIISNIASGAALYLLFLFVKRRFNQDLAMRSLLLFLAFPTAFYLNLIYTEALFLLFLVVFYVFLYRSNLRLAAGAAFFLPLIRPTGLFVIAPFAVALVLNALMARKLSAATTEEPVKQRLGPQFLYLLAPVAGFLTSLGYMALTTGDPLAAQHAQDLFYFGFSAQHVLDPLLLLKNLFGTQLVLHSYFNSVLDRLFFLGFVASLPILYRRVDKPLFVFCLMIGMQPLLGSFGSYMRLVMLGFPLYIAFASLFERRSPFFFHAVLYPLAMVQALFTAMHALNYWVA